MTVRKKVINLVVDALPETLDPVLEREHFTRPPNSIEYVRCVESGTQHIAFVFDINPRYAAGALAHLLPQVRFVFPDLNDRVLEMMGEMQSLGGRNGFTISEQCQNVAPRAVRSQATEWYIRDSDGGRPQIAAAISFITSYTLDFLRTYTSVSDLVRGYAEQDDRLPHNRRFFVFVVAAYTILNRPREAMAVLENKFGKPALRRQYARAFDYVSKLLNA